MQQSPKKAAVVSMTPIFRATAVAIHWLSDTRPPSGVDCHAVKPARRIRANHSRSHIRADRIWVASLRIAESGAGGRDQPHMVAVLELQNIHEPDILAVDGGRSGAAGFAAAHAPAGRVSRGNLSSSCLDICCRLRRIIQH
jgi:hypothetical protein